MRLEEKRCIHSFYFADLSAAEPETNQWKDGCAGIAEGLYRCSA